MHIQSLLFLCNLLRLAAAASFLSYAQRRHRCDLSTYTWCKGPLPRIPTHPLQKEVATAADVMSHIDKGGKARKNWVTQIHKGVWSGPKICVCEEIWPSFTRKGPPSTIARSILQSLPYSVFFSVSAGPPSLRTLCKKNLEGRFGCVCVCRLALAQRRP